MGDAGILNFDAQFIQSLLWQLFNTAILFFILYKLLYKPVGEFLAKRSARIAAQLADAQSQLEDASALKKQYEDKLAGIDQEKAEIIDLARVRMEKKAKELLQEANQEAQVLKERALLDIEREKDKAQDEMRHQMVEIASVMAGRYVDKSIDPALQAKLLDEAISELGDASWQN